jgi:hypothetical protein
MRLKRHSVMVRFMFGALSVSCSNSPVEFAFELNKNICYLMIQARRKMLNLARLVRKTKRLNWFRSTRLKATTKH